MGPTQKIAVAKEAAPDVFQGAPLEVDDVAHEADITLCHLALARGIQAGF